jgi:hypothetical protein
MINSLLGVGTIQSLNYVNKINDVVNLYTNNFYFIFAPATDASNTKEAEFITKTSLQRIGIYTTSPASSPNLNPPFSIDLSCVQNLLVNVTGNPLPNPLII